MAGKNTDTDNADIDSQDEGDIMRRINAPATMAAAWPPKRVLNAPPEMHKEMVERQSGKAPSGRKGVKRR